MYCRHGGVRRNLALLTATVVSSAVFFDPAQLGRGCRVRRFVWAGLPLQTSFRSLDTPRGNSRRTTNPYIGLRYLCEQVLLL